MEKLIGAIGAAAPFLAPYPSFVKALVALWLVLTAALAAALLLAAPPKREGPATVADAPERAGSKGAWLVIEGLEFFAAAPGAQVRVTAHVNGVPFVYPSVGGVEWLEVGPGMSAQKFHLPPTREAYLIRFEAKARAPARSGEGWTEGALTSVDEHRVRAPQDLPHEGVYVLHTLDPIHRARSASAEATISYRVVETP